MYALERKIHVLVTKPATQLLEHHQELVEVAKKNNVVCWVEHHKRVSVISLSLFWPLTGAKKKKKVRSGLF